MHRILRIIIQNIAIYNLIDIIYSCQNRVRIDVFKKINPEPVEKSMVRDFLCYLPVGGMRFWGIMI